MCAVSNINIDKVEVPKITHDLDIEAIRPCIYFWHFDLVDTFFAVCTYLLDEVLT